MNENNIDIRWHQRFINFKKVFKQYNTQLHKVSLVFPNKRPGVFAQKYLSEIIDKPSWMPNIYTINEIRKLASPKPNFNLFAFLNLSINIIILFSKFIYHLPIFLQMVLYYFLSFLLSFPLFLLQVY